MTELDPEGLRDRVPSSAVSRRAAHSSGFFHRDDRTITGSAKSRNKNRVGRLRSSECHRSPQSFAPAPSTESRTRHSRDRVTSVQNSKRLSRPRYKDPRTHLRDAGLRREGVFSGLYSVVEKVASSFAPTLLGLGYAWFGFQSKAPVQTTEAIDGIRYCAAFLPCFYFGISLIPLWFYRLDEKTLKSAQRA